MYCTFRRIILLSVYIFFESRLIPTLYLILGWGYQPERFQAGIYLLFDTLLASLPSLVGILFIYNYLGSLCLFLLSGSCYLVGGLLSYYPSVFLEWLRKISKTIASLVYEAALALSRYSKTTWLRNYWTHLYISGYWLRKITKTIASLVYEAARALSRYSKTKWLRNY